MLENRPGDRAILKYIRDRKGIFAETACKMCNIDVVLQGEAVLLKIAKRTPFMRLSGGIWLNCKKQKRYTSREKRF